MKYHVFYNDIFNCIKRSSIDCISGYFFVSVHDALYLEGNASNIIGFGYEVLYCINYGCVIRFKNEHLRDYDNNFCVYCIVKISIVLYRHHIMRTIYIYVAKFPFRRSLMCEITLMYFLRFFQLLPPTLSSKAKIFLVWSTFYSYI